MMPAASISAVAPQRRGILRWVIRAAGGLAVFLAAGYAALPWWLPKEWLANQLTSQLAADLDRPVYLDSVRVGWIEGVVFEGLTIEERESPSFVRPPPDDGLRGTEAAGTLSSPRPVFARVKQIRCAFKPITTLLTGRVDQIELHNPVVFLTLDHDEQLTPDDLGSRAGRRLPTLHFVIQDLLCHIQTASTRETLAMDRLECRLEQQTGILRLLGEVRTRQEGQFVADSQLRRLSIHAHVTIPRLNSDVQLGGDVRVEWHGLTLTDLPLGLIPRLPIEQVSGSTSGGITLTVRPDLGLDYDLAVALRGVHIRRMGVEHVAHVPDAEFRCSGFLDPNTDVILIHTLACQTPGVRFEGTGDGSQPSLRFDLDNSDPSELHIAGAITDWPWLAREWPELDRWATRTGLQIAGPADFRLDVHRRPNQDHAVVSLAAEGASFRLVGREGLHLNAETGLDKRLHVDLQIERGMRPRLRSHLDLAVGTCTLTAEVDLPWPAMGEPLWRSPSPDAAAPWEMATAWNEHVWPELRGSIGVDCTDLAEAVRVFPGLGTLVGPTDWRGPAQVAVSCEPGFTTSRVSATAALAADSAVTVPGWLVKPPGEALQVGLGVTVRHGDVGQFDALECAVDYGPGRLRIGGTSGQGTYRVAFAKEASGEMHPTVLADVSWFLPLRVEEPQRLGALWPEWEDWLGPHDTRAFSGTATATLRGSVSGRPGDLIARWQAEVEAGELAVRWDDLIDKPSARPLSFVLNHRVESFGGRVEHTVGIEAHQAGGRAEAQVRLGTGDARNPVLLCRQADVAIHLTDAADWLRLVPRAARALDAYRPTGALDAELTCLLSPEGHDLGLAVNATGLGFELPGNPPANKAANVPAVFGIHARSAPADLGPDTEQWTLTGGHLRWGGSALGELAGRVTIAWPSGGNIASVPVDTLLGGLVATPKTRERETPAGAAPARPRVLDAEVRTAGTMLMDDAMRDFHPRVRGWCDQFRLVGGVAADLRLEASTEQVELIGVLDAHTLTFALPFESPLIPRLRKPPGAPARITFDLMVDDWLEAPSCLVGIRDLSVVFDENELRTQGEVHLSGRSVLDLMWDHLDLEADVRLQRPEAIIEALPGGLLDILGGRAELALSLAGKRNDLRMSSFGAEFNDFLMGLGGDVIELDGSVTFDGKDVHVDHLEGAWGGSRLLAMGALPLRDGAQPGRLALTCDELSVPDLIQQWGQIRERLPVVQPDAGERVGAETSTAEAGSDALMRTFLEWFQRSEASIDLHVDTLTVPLPSEQLLTTDATWVGLNAQKGPVTVAFRGLVDGGLVSGKVVSHTQLADPTYHLTYTAEEIQPGPLVDGYLKRAFPGMTATGPLTLIDETYQKLLPLPGEPNFEVGEGELIIRGGTVAGRAAPLWMTRIFPGLNLSRFEFSYLHSWFSKLPSGRISHQMIYQGRYYNVYMIGYSDPDRRFEYEVGIDFLADYDSRYWADSGQGRIPLFVKTGWTDADGNLQDERVNFTPPRRVLDTLFVQNNLVVTAYHAVRKRVLGEK